MTAAVMRQADSAFRCGGTDLRADLTPEVGPIYMPISNEYTPFLSATANASPYHSLKDVYER